MIHFVLTLVRKEGIKAALAHLKSPDSIRFGLFTGLMVAISKAVLYFLRRLTKLDNKKISIIAGVICSVAAIMDPDDFRRKLIIFYTTARALETTMNLINEHKVAKVPENWGWLVYLFSTPFLVFLMYFEPDLAPNVIRTVVVGRAAQKPNDSMFMSEITKGLGDKSY